MTRVPLNDIHGARLGGVAIFDVAATALVSVATTYIADVNLSTSVAGWIFVALILHTIFGVNAVLSFRRSNNQIAIH